MSQIGVGVDFGNFSGGVQEKKNKRSYHFQEEEFLDTPTSFGRE